MGALVFAAELLPYLLAVAKAGGDIIEAINWGNDKVQGWKDSGTEPTDADIAELQARRHANDEIINRG
jgi:hypothetical protein